MTGELVLISGISGFVGSAVALEFLKKGYRVRGTLRSRAKADAWLEAYPQYAKQLDFALVPDISAPGAFDEAIKGADYVAHTASPFFLEGMKSAEKDMLIPAIEGTLSMLRAAASESSVKHVVLTSSFAAMEFFGQDTTGYTYSEKDWNPLTYDDAKSTDNAQMAYVASKKLAEKAAWDFVEEHKCSFGLTAINPVFVLGHAPQPLKAVKDLSVSSQYMTGFFDSKELPPAIIPPMIDVKDVADAHFAAIERRDVSKGQRYLVAGPRLDPSKMAAALRKEFPEMADRFPKPSSEPLPPAYEWDASKAVKELGVEYKTLEQTTCAAARQIIQLSSS